MLHREILQIHLSVHIRLKEKLDPDKEGEFSLDFMNSVSPNSYKYVTEEITFVTLKSGLKFEPIKESVVFLQSCE